MLENTYWSEFGARRKSLRRGLLTGAALLPIAHVMLVPQHAVAQTVISTSTGVQTWTSGDFSVTSTGSISGGSTAVTATPTGGTLANSGAIDGSFIGVLDNGNIGLLTNSGSINGSYAGISNSTGATISQLINNAGGSLTGGSIGLENAGTIGTFTNNGVISSTSGIGALNTGSISTLSNSATGSITTGGTGIFNSGGTIATLSNAGSISAGYTGISNTGSISALSNSGHITATSGDGVYNSGNINQLANASGASIQGGNFGIENNGTIGALNNSGSLSGYTAISNSGSIIALSNNGSITAGGTGLVDGVGGSIGTLTNNGLISGVATGLSVDSSSTLGELINTGTISGQTAVMLSGSGTTLINSGVISSTGGAGGTAIALSGTNNLVLDSGTQIVGGIQGGGTASDITLEGNGALTSNITSLSNGALTVAPGANWAAEGNWTVGNVINNGTFEPGAVGSAIGAPLNLTGNYVQNAGGNMVVEVTPAASSMLNVSSKATLNGNVTYVFAPGTYKAKAYTYLTAGSISGKFATETYNTGTADLSGLPQSTVYSSDPSVQLLVGQPTVVAPMDNSIFSATAQAEAQDAQATTSQLLDRVAQAGAAAPGACQAEAPVPSTAAAAGSENSAARLTGALGSEFCRAGGWIEATGSLLNAGSGNNAPGYNANTAGFLAGIDKEIDRTGTRLGVAVGYGETFLRDRIGGGSSTDIVHVALYGAQPVGRVTLSGVISYGHASTHTSRLTGIAGVEGKMNANIYSGGVQASTQVDLGQIQLVPAAGLLVAGVEGNSFAEAAPTGLGAYAISGNGAGYNSVRPYVSVLVAHSFTTASEMLVSTHARAGYEYEAGDTGNATTLYAADGTRFASSYAKLAPSNALLSAGFSVGKNNWSVYGDYIAQVAGNWTAQTGEFGVRVLF